MATNAVSQCLVLTLMPVVILHCHHQSFLQSGFFCSTLTCSDDFASFPVHSADEADAVCHFWRARCCKSYDLYVNTQQVNMCFHLQQEWSELQPLYHEMDVVDMNGTQTVRLVHCFNQYYTDVLDSVKHADKHSVRSVRLMIGPYHCINTRTEAPLQYIYL